MTKIDGRSRAEASRQLDESLPAARGGHVGVVKIDLVETLRSCGTRIRTGYFTRGAAMAALEDVHQAGQLRSIGFTGHKDPDSQHHMVERADRHGVCSDAAQMPLTVMDADNRSLAWLVVPELVRRGKPVPGMRSLAKGIRPRSRRGTPGRVPARRP